MSVVEIKNDPVEFVSNAVEENLEENNENESLGKELQFEETSIEMQEEFETKEEEENIEEEEERTHAENDDLYALLNDEVDDLEESEDDTFKEIPPPEHIFQKREPLPPTFLDLFKKLPNMDEISLSESLAREIAMQRGETHEMEPAEEITDEGEEAVEQEHEPLDEPVVDTVIEAESSSEYSDFEFDFESSERDQEHLIEQRVGDENLFEAILKEQMSQTVVVEKQDSKLIERLREMKVLKNDTKAFLHALLDSVVYFLEHRDTRDILREFLDKAKLFKELGNLVEELNTEQKVHEFIHGKCIYYYRRQKSFRQITPEDKKQSDFEVIRYERALQELDAVLGNEKCTQEIITKQVEKSQELAASLEKQRNYEISQLESLIRNTFKTRDSDNLKLIIDRAFKAMSNLRKDISAVRETFIRWQHTKETLLQKKKRLDNITDTLTLREYELLLLEHNALFEKIEEKSARFERKHREFCSHTNVVSHIKNKQCILASTIQDQLKELAAAELKERNLRAYIFKLKTSRVKVKKQIEEESLKHGLIGKPGLLLDFDKTTDRIQELKIKVDRLRSQNERNEYKIRSLEGSLA